jgi:hypothetical protein
MTALAVVFGVGMFIVLLIRNPAAVGLIVAGLVVVVAGIGILGYAINKTANEQYRRRLIEHRQALDSVPTSVRHDTRVCSPTHPLAVTTHNMSNRRLLEVRFSIRGYRPGYSKPVAEMLNLSSDRILAPGETGTECWQLRGQHGTEHPSGYHWKVETTDIVFAAG